MLFEFFLSLRYLKAKRKQAFISVISLISIAGVMLGVMSLIVVLSVMNGMKAEFISRILGIRPHIRVSSYAGSFNNYDELLKNIQTVDGVIAASPSITSEVRVNSGYALLSGVDPDSIAGVIDITPMIKEGDISSLNKTHDGFPSIIVGSGLAQNLGVGSGDIIKVISPDGKLTPLGRRPNNQEFMVTGLFKSGILDYDRLLAYISLKEAQKLVGMKNRITNIEVNVNNANKSDIISTKIKKMLGFSYLVQDWKVTNQSLLDAMQLEKYGMFIILVMIVLVGALNIISALVMTVMEKSRDIAILRTMGAAKKSIMSVFMFQGIFVGVVGTVAGACSGLGICYLLSEYKFIKIPSDVYPSSTLPVLVNPVDVMAVVLAGLVLSFLATIYPSWHASRLKPVETLRYE